MKAVWLYAVFFLSGICGLGYQMVWSRLFAIGLGHELPGVLAVVAAFFAGLALGAWILDRPVSRSRRPGRWYAGLEMVIGLWGLASILLIPRGADLAAGWIGLEPSPFRHWAIAFLLPFLLLLPATTAMGATLPAMERWAAPLEEGGRCVGKLYAINTLGAVAGTVLGAFAVLPILGFAGTLASLAALNLVCAAAAWALDRPGSRPRPGLAKPAPMSPPLARTHLSVFMTGLLGIGYEVLGVRVLAEVLENTIFSFAAALSVYLLGTALGAAWSQRRAGREASRSMDLLLSGLAAAVLLGAWTMIQARSIYARARGIFGDGPLAGPAAEALVALAVFGLPTFFMGAVYSRLVQGARRDDGGVGSAAALNTLGSAIAPLLFGVILLPALGAKWSLVMVSVGYLALVPWQGGFPSSPVKVRARRSLAPPSLAPPELLEDRLRAGHRWAGRSWVATLLPLGLIVLLPARLQQVEKPPGGEILEYRQGVMASVAVTRHFDGHRSLLVNNRFIMGGTGAAPAARRHAQIPLLLHPDPRRALFLGLGTGITFASAGAHPGLEADGVELVPEVVEMLHHFEPENALRPGLRIHTADARRFIRSTRQQYDVIVADLFHPARDGAGALYTLEHFQAIRRRLTPGGMFCQWLPLFQLDEATLQVILRTFLEVFPDARAHLLRFNVDTPVLGLIATLEAVRYPADWFERRVRDPELVKELNPLNLTDRFQLFGTWVASAGTLRAYAGAARVNTELNPVVLFSAPRFAYQRGETAHGRLFALLDRATTELGGWIGDESDGSAAFRRDLGGFIAARNTYLRGLLLETSGEVAAAIDAYVESARISRHFSTGYAHGLTLAMEQARANPEMARALLGRLAEAQPDRPVARDLLRRLFPGSETSP